MKCRMNGAVIVKCFEWLAKQKKHYIEMKYIYLRALITDTHSAGAVSAYTVKSCMLILYFFKQKRKQLTMKKFDNYYL